jgi:hypothetical protein
VTLRGAREVRRYLSVILKSSLAAHNQGTLGVRAAPMPAHAAGPNVHRGRAASRPCRAESLPLCPCPAAPRPERRSVAGKRPARQGAGPRALRPQALELRPDARLPRRPVCRAGSAALDAGAWDAADDGAPAAEEVQPPAGPVSRALAQAVGCARSLGLLDWPFCRRARR